MSKEPLPCPFCGQEPQTSLIDDVTHYACQTLDCICEDMWATLEEWNRRFVCLDMNGKKVYTRDKVRYILHDSEQFEGVIVWHKVGYFIKRRGLGLWTVDPGEIELVKSDGG